MRRTLRYMRMTERLSPIVIDDQRFYNVHQAAQIVETISEATLWHWAKHGTTPFGFELGVIRKPVTQHRSRKSNGAPPTQPRTYRMLIPETKVLALKEICAMTLSGPVLCPMAAWPNSNPLLTASVRRNHWLDIFRTPEQPL